MQSGERLEAVKRILERLKSEDWAEIDLTLDSFGLPTNDSWHSSDDKRGYIVAMLRGEDTDKISDLDGYLAGPSSAGGANWEDGPFRLFFSHLAVQRKTAHELKSALRPFGVDAFVAHDDIDPGAEWQHAMERALGSCDALAALLHDGFRESSWCAQEVGFVLGRGLPVVPVKFDLDPYGFFGSVQALPGRTVHTSTLARRIVDVLLKDKRTADRLREAIVSALEGARSFAQANMLVKLLAEEPEKVTPDQLQRLRQAEKENREVSGAFEVEAALGAIERVVGVATPWAASPTATRGGYAYDEEPF